MPIVIFRPERDNSRFRELMWGILRRWAEFFAGTGMRWRLVSIRANWLCHSDARVFDLPRIGVAEPGHQRLGFAFESSKLLIDFLLRATLGLSYESLAPE